MHSQNISFSFTCSVLLALHLRSCRGTHYTFPHYQPPYNASILSDSQPPALPLRAAHPGRGGKLTDAGRLERPRGAARDEVGVRVARGLAEGGELGGRRHSHCQVQHEHRRLHDGPAEGGRRQRPMVGRRSALC